MKKTNTRLLLTFVLVLVFAALLAVAAFAATPGTGYCVNAENNQTNIKWTMAEDGVLTFEIDPAATDKIQTTVLYNRDPVKGTGSNWEKCLPTFTDATKIVIGDGITQIAGFSALRQLKQVELAESVTKLDRITFECSYNLESVYVRGTEPEKGVFDFSNILSIGEYCCDGVFLISKVIFNPNLTGDLEVEIIKNTRLVEVEIPAGVNLIKDRAFMQSNSLKVITILGMETRFQSDEVFSQSIAYPAIKAKAGSKAAEFAKANGYTFIDLDTGETTKGTKPTTGDPSVTPSTGIPEFKHEGATVWGHSTGKYNGQLIIDTNWAYYKETKTLEFVSATRNYNETGDLSHVDKDGQSWSEYKNEIEHIIVGDYIDKISNNAFADYPALIDVRMGKNVNQIDPDAFAGCTSLTTVWRNGGARVEGRVDLTGISKVNDAYRNTAITEILLPATVRELTVDLSSSIKTIYVYQVTDALIDYAKNNLFNLQSITNPDIKYDFWVYIDPSLPACGARSVFDFDEATGTMTIYGTGKIDSIVNYYGGGAKKQPWVAIKKDVKHIVIADTITSLGKYAFCEFVNLETVQIPAEGEFEILTSAFEKCHNLKSIYRSGTEPIEGTADLRNVHTLNTWSFAYDWLIANVIISPEVKKIGSSVFEENINLANIYGTPGSYAETYAAENGKTFYDIASNVPQPITCTPPETTAAETETDAPETTKVPDAVTETDIATDSGADTNVESMPTFVDEDDVSGDSSPMLFIIIAVVAVVAVAAVVVIVIVAKKKKAAK